MEIVFNITMYHGTDLKNLIGISRNGFKKDTISCASIDKEVAAFYGDLIVSFKSPFKIRVNFKTLHVDLIYLRTFIYDYYYKNLICCVAGLKPKSLSHEYIPNRRAKYYHKLNN
jgi:hypothetical protein